MTFDPNNFEIRALQARLTLLEDEVAAADSPDEQLPKPAVRDSVGAAISYMQPFGLATPDYDAAVVASHPVETHLRIRTGAVYLRGTDELQIFTEHTGDLIAGVTTDGDFYTLHFGATAFPTEINCDCWVWIEINMITHRWRLRVDDASWTADDGYDSPTITQVPLFQFDWDTSSGTILHLESFRHHAAGDIILQGSPRTNFDIDDKATPSGDFLDDDVNFYGDCWVHDTENGALFKTALNTGITLANGDNFIYVKVDLYAGGEPKSFTETIERSATNTLVDDADTWYVLLWYISYNSTTKYIEKAIRYNVGAAHFWLGILGKATTGDFALSAGNLELATSQGVRVNATTVLTDQQTGWTAASGTAARTTFATATVTLEELAKRVKALIDDLMTHGMIGA